MLVGSAPNFPDGAIVSNQIGVAHLRPGPDPRASKTCETVQDRIACRLLSWVVHHAIFTPRWSR